MRNFLLLLALLFGLVSAGQPTLSLRGYKQVVLPGTVPVGSSTKAPPSARIGKKAATRYYLFLAYAGKETIRPHQVWINKKAYQVSTEAVDRTPIEHTNRNLPAQPVTTVLVPPTKDKVVRIVPGEAAAGTPLPPSAQKLIETSELVVSYQWKGKTFYKALKKITELEPEMME